MGKYYNKIYKFRNLSISILINEIIIIFKSNNKIYIKTVKRKNFSLLKKIYFLVIPLFFILLISYFLFNNNNNNNNSYILNGESQKNQLLFSKETDFSSPKQSNKLIIRKHKIKKGETLSEIAKKYGVSMDTICGSSQLISYDIIRVGQLLKIPNQDGILYSLKKGESIISISKKLTVSIKKLFSVNNIKNPDFISIGSVLFFPDAKPLNIIPGFLWPSQNRYITSSYGWRRHPLNKRKHFHQGIDIRSKYQWVRNTKYGKITFTGWLGGYGKTIIIAHPAGFKSLYGHLSKIVVRKGQYIKQGQIIAKSGNTGYSSGPHLHFELLKNGRHLNPYRYLK